MSFFCRFYYFSEDSLQMFTIVINGDKHGVIQIIRGVKKVQPKASFRSLF